MGSNFQMVYSVSQETAGLQLLLIQESGSCVLEQEGRGEKTLGPRGDWSIASDNELVLQSVHNLKEEKSHTLIISSKVI